MRRQTDGHERPPLHEVPGNSVSCAVALHGSGGRRRNLFYATTSCVTPDARAKVGALRAELDKVILGKAEVIEHVLAALLAGCHILMEDVPGVGQTTLAK